jgi:gamma-glutamylcyclotransferase (GGCT)/AIG2-like uncharacterized protein YtfP
MNKENILIFVYGTLKSGKINSSVLKKSGQFIKEDTLSGFKMHKISWFPAVFVSNDKNDIIHGEVYSINTEFLKTLDIIEGYPYLYQRKKVKGYYIYYMKDKKLMSCTPELKSGKF